MPRYLYLNRPPGIGCQPDGYTEIKHYWPRREYVEAQGDAGIYEQPVYGWVDYPEPLTPYQCWKWDFLPVDRVESFVITLSRLALGDWALRTYWELPDAELEEYAMTTALPTAIRGLKAAGFTFEQVADRLRMEDGR